MKFLLLFLISLNVFGEFVDFSGDLSFEKIPRKRIGCYEKEYYFHASLEEDKANDAKGSFILIHSSIHPKEPESRFLGTFQVSKVLKVEHEGSSYIDFKGKWIYKDSEMMKISKKHRYLNRSYYIADEIPSFTPKFETFSTQNISTDEVLSKIKKGETKVKIASISARGKNYEIFISVPEKKVVTTIPGLPILINSYMVMNSKGEKFYADRLNNSFEAYDLNGDSKIDLVFGYYTASEHKLMVLLLSYKNGYKLGLFCEPTF